MQMLSFENPDNVNFDISPSLVTTINFIVLHDYLNTLFIYIVIDFIF